MSTNRYRHRDYDLGSDRSCRERRRSRSRSRSRKFHENSSNIRSRSRSVDRHNHYGHNSSNNRSRSTSRGQHRSERRPISHRPRDSRSRSRSYERQNKRHGERKCSAHAARRVEEDVISIATKHDAIGDINLDNLPLPRRETTGAYYNLNVDEPIDKERIHREIEEKLRLALAKEGKVYPPKKPEASHPVFANDGSFLEIFKKMQAKSSGAGNTDASSISSLVPPACAVASPSTKPPPIVGRRRGGKILKTGVVAKPKSQTETSDDPKDFWSLYLAEVNKYKSHACESDTGNRPLVK